MADSALIGKKKTAHESTITYNDIGYQGQEKTDGAKGKSNKSAIKGIFGSSPLPGYNGNETIKVEGEPDLDLSSPETYRQWFFDNVVKGTVSDANWGLGTYNREFGDAPNLADVVTGGGGLPATPYVPNPVSPGEGSTNPAGVAPAPADFTDKLTPDGSPFSGNDIVQMSDLAETAKKIVDSVS